ncbi:DMT family transporter [Tistrella bauzanensis]
MTAAADGPTGTVRDQRAVAAMLLAVAMLSSMDVVMKLLSGSHGVGQMVLMKSLASLPWIAVWWLVRPQAAVWRVRRPAIHLLRGVLLAIAGFGFFHAFTLLPLAEAYAILFTAPIAAVLLAWGLMGERPGRGTGIALAAGFAGVLVVAAPGLMVQGLTARRWAISPPPSARSAMPAWWSPPAPWHRRKGLGHCPSAPIWWRGWWPCPSP